MFQVVAFERIRRKHSAEQEDRCGILYQQLVAGHLRRDGGSFGVSADVAKAALAFYEYIYIYTYYIEYTGNEAPRAWLFVVLTRTGQATCRTNLRFSVNDY